MATQLTQVTFPNGDYIKDTKNTAGSTDTSSKIFLIGATSQAANPQTYSQDTAYVGTDGCLYSGGTKVLTAHQDISGKADKATTLAGYGITDAKISNGTITLGSNTITPLTSAPVSSVAGKTGAVTLTSSDVGLGNVGNFKAVSTVASQGLTDTEKSNARTNIGAGTSNLTIGTTYNTAAAGNHTHNAIYPTNGESDTSYKGCTLDYNGLTVGSGSGSALAQYRVKVTSQDITAQDFTWDGTNTSLKTAITTIANRNWYTYVEFDDKTSVAANTVTNLGTWKPTVGGVYLIQYVARFSANASGYRKIYIASSATASDGLDRFARVSVQACNGDHTYIELVAIETLTANTTYYFNAIHNASAAVNISYPGLKIMRIR